MRNISERTLIILALILAAAITASTGHEDVATWFGLGIFWAVFLL